MTARILALFALSSSGCVDTTATHDDSDPHTEALSAVASDGSTDEALDLLTATCPAGEPVDEQCPPPKTVSPADQETYDTLVSSCEQWLERAPADYAYIQDRECDCSLAFTQPVLIQVCGGAVAAIHTDNKAQVPSRGTMVDLYWELASHIEQGANVDIDYGPSGPFIYAPFPSAVLIESLDTDFWLSMSVMYIQPM
ncbi:MAG: hypothetical protein ACI8RZ_002510 [Myxococcota bacterium]|jgi:hypothetical protein